MCGRFTLTVSGEALAEHFNLAETPEVVARYNIAPTQPVAAVRSARQSGERELTYLHWGLIPAWAQDPAIGSRMINARAETAAEKPAFRAAFKYRRCLVPASGFYEWQKIDGRKQPVFIHLAGGDLFAFASLWEHWQSPDGSEVNSCTLLTTGPNELIRPVHDRMPVILRPEEYDLWLDRDVQQVDRLRPLLRPFPAERMAFFPVSPRVNSPANEGPDCIAPLTA
jgi:putative SOS response-associated peptidase YedK